MLDGLTRVLLSSLTSNPACRYGVIKRTGIAQHCASRLEGMAILVYELKLAPCYAPVRNVTGEVYLSTFQTLAVPLRQAVPHILGSLGPWPRALCACSDQLRNIRFYFAVWRTISPEMAIQCHLTCHTTQA